MRVIMPHTQPQNNDEFQCVNEFENVIHTIDFSQVGILSLDYDTIWWCFDLFYDFKEIQWLLKHTPKCK